MTTLYFDPSRGVQGYTSEEYRQLLARYTNSLVQNYSAGQCYRALANRALVAAQRWKRIPFVERSRFPRLSVPLPPFRHYVPGQSYSEGQLAEFYRHYRVETLAELDDVHKTATLYIPLDPSFMVLVEELRSSVADEEILAYLRGLFNVNSNQELFAYYESATTLDDDVDGALLASNPLMFLSNDSLPHYLVREDRGDSLPRGTVAPTPHTPLYTEPSTAYVRLVERARAMGIDTSDRSTLDLLLELGEPLPEEYTLLIEQWQGYELPDDGSEVSRVIQTTEPRTLERQQALNRLSSDSLQRYASHHQLTTSDPVSLSWQRHDLITALSFVRGHVVATPGSSPTEVLDYDRIDPFSPQPYSVRELLEWSQLMGLEPSDEDPIILANDLYFALSLPTFHQFVELAPGEIAYGTAQQSDIYTYGELLSGFAAYQDTSFSRMAIRRLQRLLEGNTDSRSLQLVAAIEAYLTQGLSQTSLLNFLREIPDIPIYSGTTVTGYTHFVSLILNKLRDMALELMGDNVDRVRILSDFYDVLDNIPMSLADAVLDLALYDQDDEPLEETIAEAYNLLSDGGDDVVETAALLRSTAEHYLREFHESELCPDE